MTQDMNCNCTSLCGLKRKCVMESTMQPCSISPVLHFDSFTHNKENKSLISIKCMCNQFQWNKLAYSVYFWNIYTLSVDGRSFELNQVIWYLVYFFKHCGYHSLPTTYCFITVELWLNCDFSTVLKHKRLIAESGTQYMQGLTVKSPFSHCGA